MALYSQKLSDTMNAAFVAVIWVNSNLVISTHQVRFGEDSSSIELIKQIFNTRQWTPNLGRDLVQAGVVHTHTHGFFTKITGTA